MGQGRPDGLNPKGRPSEVLYARHTEKCPPNPNNAPNRGRATTAPRRDGISNAIPDTSATMADGPWGRS